MEAKALLSPEVTSNMKLVGTKEYSLLCEAVGSLSVLEQKLKKEEKKDVKQTKK